MTEVHETINDTENENIRKEIMNLVLLEKKKRKTAKKRQIQLLIVAVHKVRPKIILLPPTTKFSLLNCRICLHFLLRFALKN